MEIKKGLELNDLLLVPKSSEVNSREEVGLESMVGNIKLNIPIIASPMSGIVGTNLIEKLGELGGIGILHRFYNDRDTRTLDFLKIRRSSVQFGVAVGLNDSFYKYACEYGASIICVDVANGYLKSVLDFTDEVSNYIKNNNLNCLVMSGNVATFDGAKTLYDSGAKLIRVGIGSGKLCTTRNNTGIGVPQATAISDCSYYLNNEDIYELGRKERINPRTEWRVVADGGIKNSGDAVKALALGASFIMIGSLFARCYESDNNGEISGMASQEFQEQFYGEVKKSVEGVSQKVVKDISLEKFITQFCWNMKSGFTYTNSRSIPELHYNAEFITTGSGSIESK